MLRCPNVPLLPGSVFRDFSKTRFHKSQQFVYNGIIPAIAVEEIDRSGIFEKPREPEDAEPFQPPPIFPPHLTPKLPPWLAFDKKVLCFRGYFKDTVQGYSTYQIRRVKIYYYLEDDTIQISEPRTGNSGIPQGCLVSRQRIPKVMPDGRECITILDLNVDTTVTIYDRVYHITDCDLYTRHFLKRLGITVPNSVEIPVDPTIERRKHYERGSPTDCGMPKNYSFGRFLKNDRKVLRFRAYWDDRHNQFGEIRDLMLYYFLADETIEIQELLPVNSGRHQGNAFLRRTKLPKQYDGTSLGEDAPFSVLNVLCQSSRNCRYIPDVLRIGDKKRDFYKDGDLKIGSTINVYGRAVVLTDCDGFTKNYYQKKYGIEDFPEVARPYDYEKVTIRPEDRELPPYNGWGSHEDSEGNCKTVEPKPPQRDFVKFINFDGCIMRFGAKLLSKFTEDGSRVFIVSYYLSDDTVSVYELPIRNSGFNGGDFIKRCQIPLPGQQPLAPQRPKLFTPQHFYIGATVMLKNHKFRIVTADEYALCYMEKKSNEFPYSNIQSIMTKVREAIRPIYKDFIAKYLQFVCTSDYGGNLISVICFTEMKAALIELLGDRIHEHEIITLCRYFSAEKKNPNPCERERVRSISHLELTRNIWNNMDRLKEHIYHLNSTNNGFLPETNLLTSIRALRMPLDVELIKSIFAVLNRNDELEIDLDDFFKFIDVKFGSQPIQPVNTKRSVCPDIPFTQAGRLVDWIRFIQFLGLEEELKKEAD